MTLSSPAPWVHCLEWSPEWGEGEVGSHSSTRILSWDDASAEFGKAFLWGQLGQSELLGRALALPGKSRGDAQVGPYGVQIVPC